VRPPSPARLRSKTSLKANVKASQFGRPITLAAPVKVGGKIRKMAAGSVTFYDGASVLGTAMVRRGMATFTTRALPIGRNAIRAVFSGDQGMTPSTSAVRIETIHADRSKNAVFFVRSRRGLRSL
jgi:hypothetical protein